MNRETIQFVAEVAGGLAVLGFAGLIGLLIALRLMPRK